MIHFCKTKEPLRNWKKGSGVLLFGTFAMLLTMTMCLFFVETFFLQQEHMNAQTAADSIADASAVYATTESSDYDDIVNHATEVQQMVKEQTGVETSNLTIDRSQLEDESKVSVSLGILGKYISDITLSSGRNGNLGDYNARANATTEFTQGRSGLDIVEVALAEVGNSGGEKYRRWYYNGVSLDVAWCAIFVSWCANECGYLDSIIPKYASCANGAQWFKDCNRWADNTITPEPGYIIFFGPNGGDHTGIVERSENGIVYTVEGNYSDSVSRAQHAVGNSYIAGYGMPAY